GESSREGSVYGYEAVAPSPLVGLRYFPALTSRLLIGPVVSVQYYVGDFDLDRGSAGRFLLRPGAGFLLDYEHVYVHVPVTFDAQVVPPMGQAVVMSSALGTGVGTGLDFGVFLPRRDGVFASFELSIHYDWLSQHHTFTAETSGRTFSEQATYELLWFGVSAILNWRKL
ncbi:MAG TPA: hypothetical protein VLC09_03270, partial [Polyangiaceae bacterium]|nr:hypothetical protein [Polyangiaceae bacterium]